MRVRTFYRECARLRLVHAHLCTPSINTILAKQPNPQPTPPPHPPPPTMSLPSTTGLEDDQPNPSKDDIKDGHQGAEDKVDQDVEKSKAPAKNS